jgi:hypothetical protein
VAAGLDAQHAEPIAGVMEGDPLDRAGQHLGGLAGSAGRAFTRRGHHGTG